jgi:hypothetical protein
METESTIPPFVFVDGRKYVLAETEELPEPEMFAKLTPPPRNVSSTVRWRLYLRHEMELFTLAVFVGGAVSTVMTLILAADAPHVCGLVGTMFCSLLPFAYFAASRVYSGRHETRNALQLLQDGLAGKGRFAGICATEKVVDKVAEMKLTYQFTTQNGNTYNASFCMANVKKIMSLSTEKPKLIFYDPVKPSRNVLFDTLPKGIEFDEIDEVFRTKQSFLVVQILWLCFGVAVFPLIFGSVYAFLC